MKRKFSLSILTILVVTILNAQDLKFGLVANGQLTTMVENKETINDIKPRFGYSMGIGLWADYHNGWTILTEIKAVNKGSTFELNSSNKVELKLYYVQFDMFVKKYFGEKLYMGLGYYFGPQFDSKNVVKVSGIESEVGDVLDSGFDAGLGLMIGTKLNEKISLDGRFNHGFINQTSSSMVKTYFQNLSINLTFQLNNP